MNLVNIPWYMILAYGIVMMLALVYMMDCVTEFLRRK